MTGAKGFGFIVVPYERTTTYHRGAALGPEAVMEDWRRLVRAGEAPPPSAVITLPAAALGGPAAMMTAVESAAGDLIAEGLLPILLGGEHTSTLGAVAALNRGPEEMGVVQFDAHADLRRSYGGSRYNHACVMRRLHQDRGLPLLPIGIRALSRQEAAYIRERSLGFLPGRRLGEWKQLLPPLLRRLPRRIYLTVDMDFFDPSVVPGVGTPEPGGGEWYGTLDLLDNILSEKEIIGFDIVELCPPRERRVSVRAAARLAKYLLGRIDFTFLSFHNTRRHRERGLRPCTSRQKSSSPRAPECTRRSCSPSRSRSAMPGSHSSTSFASPASSRPGAGSSPGRRGSTS